MKKVRRTALAFLMSASAMIAMSPVAIYATGPDTATGSTPGGTAPDAAGGVAPSVSNTSTGSAPGGAGGGTTAVTDYTAVNDITTDTEESDGTYDSTGTDENVFHVSNGATLILNNPTITRTSTDSTGGDNSSFYGVGAALLVTDGTAYVNGGTIVTDAQGSAGLFAYSDGVVYAANAVISTTGDTAGGIHVAGGGTLYAWDLEVTTQGGSSAAIRSDRGGGTMVVDGGTYTSNGNGSPAVYVTADITVNDAVLTANGSEAVCIEGLNTLRLFNCDLTGNMTDMDQNDSTWTVIVYQSMSGDSEVGTGTFYMIDGTLTSGNGGLFYTTNTSSEFYLENVTITQSEDSEYFLMCTGNTNQRGWGTSGANGATCNFTAVQQEMNGDVIWDSISQLDFYILDGSSLTGAVIDDETYAGSGGSGYAAVYVDESSTWTVTGDSTVTNLCNAGTIVDESGNTVTIQGSDGTVYVEGDSDYVITVTGTYDTSVDTSGALTAVSYDDYKVDVPSQLDVTTTAAETTAAATASASASASAETDTSATSSGSNTGWIIAGCAAVVIIAALLMKKKK